MSNMKPEEVRRCHIIGVSLTREEKQSIVKAALAEGMPPAMLVRRAALEAAARQKQSA
jgi:hypothetical protein